MTRINRILMVGLVIIAIFHTIGSAQASTITVCSSGCDFMSIQAAINPASDGSTIIVYNGTYYEHIIVNKSIILEGKSNIATNVIGGFNITANNVTIKNFKILGGYSWQSNIKSGIYSKSSQNTFYNNYISNIYGVAGMNGIEYHPGENGEVAVGIYLAPSSSYITIAQNTISGAIIGGRGGDGNSFNRGGFGGMGAGIYLMSSNHNSIIHNIISGAIIGGRGGDGGYQNDGGIGGIGVGIYLDSSVQNNLTNNSVSGITGGNGGKGGDYGYGGIGGLSAGIYLDSSIQNILAYSNISYIRGGNGGHGGYAISYVMIGGDGTGIYFSSSIKNNISKNIVSQISGGAGGFSSLSPGQGGNGAGIYFTKSSENNSLTQSTMASIIGGKGVTEWGTPDNGFGYALYLKGASNNFIYFNNFINNNSNAYSDLSNIWNSTLLSTYSYNNRFYKNYRGNYWNDYKGNDTNRDGIGDTPYHISSDRDNYPLIEMFGNYMEATQYFYGYPTTAYSNQEIELTVIVDLTQISMNLGDPVQWNITTPGGETITGESDTLKCCITGGLYDNAYYDFLQNGIYTIKVVFPGYTEFAEWNVEVMDEPPNRPPVITSITANPSSVTQGGTTSITVIASDPDNDALSYSYDPTGGTISGSGSAVTWTADTAAPGAPAIHGTFRVYVTVSDGKDVARGSVDVTVTDENKPDLIIQDITWPSPDPRKGENVPITVTVKNAGNADAGASHVGLFIRGMKAGSLYVDPIASGVAVSKTFTWTAGSCASTGVSAIADVDNEVGESRKDNNNMETTINVRCPDLVISDISWKNQSGGSEIYPGDEVSFFYTIKNQGSADTPAEFNNFLYIDGERWDISARISLAAGQSQDRFFTRTWQAADGSHSIKVVADGYREIDESGDEKYNEKVGYLMVDQEPLNLIMTGVEVTQGIQNLNNDIPLIEGKKTVVRIYLKSYSEDIENVTGKLKAFRNSDLIGEINYDNEKNNNFIHGSSFPYGESRPVNPERAYSIESLLFELPEDWLKGSITIQFELSMDSRYKSDMLCNEIQNCEINLFFNKIDKLTILFVPIRYKPTKDTPDIESFESISLLNFIQVYPLKRDDIVPIVENYPWEIDYNPTEDLSSKCLWQFGNCYIRLFQEIETILSKRKDIKTKNYHAYGVVPSMLFHNVDWSGRSPIGSHVSFGSDDSPKTMLHEIGHNYELKHINCPSVNITTGIPTFPDNPDNNWPYPGDECHLAPKKPSGFWGFDTNMGSPRDPYDYADFMSYGYSRWVSNYTYKALFDKFKERDVLISQSENSLLVSQESIEVDMLLVRGFINISNDEVIFGNFFHNYKVQESLSTTGEYFIEIQNSSHKALADYSFDVTRTDGSNNTFFVESIPYHPGTAFVIIKHNSLELASVTVSAYSPSVTIISPNGGETLSGAINVTWAASDIDGDRLNYIIDYSPDNGTTWQTLTIDFNDTRFPLNTSYLQGSRQGLIRITATDGVNTGSDISDTVFTVLKKPPEVTIVNPSSGTMIIEGSYITLTGAGYDLEDGMLNGSNLTWYSDQNGILGNGTDIWTRNLTRGVHNITLTAKDSDGKRATDQITISVIDSATIDTPGGTAQLSVTDGVIVGASRVNESLLPVLSGQVFPFGVFNFNISQIGNGQTVNVSIELSQDLPSGARYWKYGKTIDNTDPHWYEIPMVVSEENRTVTIQLTDGGTGDDDLIINGVIVDAGAPGIDEDLTPLESLTDLHNTTLASDFINWTWTNPPDPDYHHVMLYLNGTFLRNVTALQNYSNITGLTPDTSYELGTHTVDSSGNINGTWVNATARTLPSGAVPPVADCGADKPGCENVGAKVQFNGSASYDPDGGIDSYYWEFGDGKTGTGAEPNHTYAGYGWNGSSYQPFIVNLTVTDNDGLLNSTSHNVTIWIAGDANGDGKVNILDASVVGLKWNGNDPCADLNNDGKVNILDASIIGLNWGKVANIGG